MALLAITLPFLGYSLLPGAPPRPHVGGRAANPVCQAPRAADVAPDTEEAKNKLQQTLSAIASLRPQKGVVTPTSPAPQAAGASDAASSNRLVVVSNRLPFSCTPGADGYQFVMASGGLVSAMLGVMEDDSMTWVGWPGIATPETAEERESIEAQFASHKCQPVFIEQKTMDLYYNGFANDVLWPLFHYFQDVLDVNPIVEQWDAYKEANAAFADALIPTLKPGDLVWVHDYHLMLLPSMLKQRMPELNIGWFLHTPFPTSEVFRMLPMRKELLQGVLGADLLGFHTSECAPARNSAQFFRAFRRAIFADAVPPSAGTRATSARRRRRSSARRASASSR